MKGLLFFTISLIFTISVYSQAPKFSNDFLNIGVGARGLAMGSAVSATSVDVTGAYWNPAEMALGNSNFQVAGQHAQWYSGIGNYDYVGFGKRLDSDKRSFGAVSLIRMGIDDIPNTLRLRGPDGSIDYSRISSFSVADYALLVSYGRRLGNVEKDSPFSIGANLKLIHRTFGSFAKSFGFGFDAGIAYEKSGWHLSMMARDITTTFNAYKFSFSDEEKATLQLTGNDIPKSSVEVNLPKLILGIAYNIKLSNKIGLLPCVDIEFSGNGTSTQLLPASNLGIDPRIGFELDFKRKIFLRFGANNFQSIPSLIDPNKKDFSVQPSGGLGLKLGRIGLDYALTNIASTGVGLYSHYISLNLDF
ncbi:MAG: PorV/PorQ family protein [Saprospiraceae bacterium]